MAGPTELYLIGDDKDDISKELKYLLSQTNDPILSSFLSQAYQALRTTVGATSYHFHEQFDRFASIADLLDLKDQERLHPALNEALACVYQFGIFIW